MSMHHLSYPTDFTISHAADHQLNPHLACAEEVSHAR
jgi:hypothetical protein